MRPSAQGNDPAATQHAATDQSTVPATAAGPAPPAAADDESPQLSTTPLAGAPADAPAVLGSFGKYELLHQVAVGGMGVVYKAHDRALGRVVALKRIRAGILAAAEEIQRFQREAQAAAHLKHPHIVSIFEIGEHDGHHYFTMTFAEHGSLAGQRPRFAEPRAAAALVEKIARAVHYAHDKGVLHRDLKPANVLLDEHDEPLVSDFGLAKLLDSNVELTQSGQMLGTPAYMAPEQAAGRSAEVGAGTDVWALGVLLYELLTGRRPFTGPGRDALLHQILTTDPPTPSSLGTRIDRGLERIILRCLAREPARRYPSAAALADDLQRWLRGDPILPPEPRSGWLRGGAGRQSAVVAAVLIVAAVVVGVPTAILLRARNRLPPPLTLIGDNQPPALHWAVGEQYVTKAVPQPGGVFTVSATDISLLELRDQPPWPSYRLEGEVRHDDALAPGNSAVGLYFAYKYRPSSRPERRFLLHLSFTEHEGLTQAAGLDVARLLGADPPILHAGSTSREILFRSPYAPGVPHPWHQLAAEVTPEGVCTFFDAEPLQPVLAQVLADEGLSSLRRNGDGEWAYAPHGAVGLIVYKGTGSFRNVTIAPLRVQH